jgi:tetratricopeptide (TPR) repeat protein
MKKNIFVAWLLLLAGGLAGKTLVLPLAVDSQNHASSQWLGKAVSFFLIAGLEQNSLPVSDEVEVQALLNRNLVRFPFAITKATAMILAGEDQAERLLWGKILYSDKKTSQMQVQLFLIDIRGGTQRHLPLVKGNFADMVGLQEELLRNVVKAIGSGPPRIAMPQLNMTLPEYERFIKSLLLNDAGKKLELLLPAPGKTRRSDFINFELAKISLEKRDLAGCRSYLDLVADGHPFKDRKDFLLAMADFFSGAEEAAMNRFIRLQQQNTYPVAVHNNLGVLYQAKGNFPLAEKCLRYALFLQKDPGIQANLIVLLQAMGQGGAALQELTAALRRFPEDGKLLKLFASFVAAAENKDELSLAFRNYVPLPLSEERLLPVEPLLLNPFEIRAAGVEAAPGNPLCIEARNLFLENDFEGARQKAEEAMEVNPFEPDNHHLLALLSLQKKQFAQADTYAQSALFLAETLDHYLLQLKIQKAGNELDKFRRTLALALRKFPQSPELLQLGGR